MAICTVTNEIGGPSSCVGQMTLSLVLKKFYVRNHFKEAVQTQKVLEFGGESYVESIDLRVVFILKLFEVMGVNEIFNRRDTEQGFSNGHGWVYPNCLERVSKLCIQSLSTPEILLCHSLPFIEVWETGLKNT